MAERTCIATGQNLPKYKLIRFVIAPDGFVVADLVGRLPGRGAWVAANETAIRIADQKGHLPVNFLTDNDITGGNSGSPVLNGKGELIGLAFDGNIEAMAGDVIFDKKLQRTINVDIRYVLWLIDKYSNAKHIVDELTIVTK